MSVREVLLVRHGVGEGQAGRCIGWTDVPLAAIGAEAIGALATSGRWRPVRLLSSDLARATASAAVLATAWDLPAPIGDARLREMHFGVWDGRAWDALAREDGTRLDAWMARWWAVAAPEGEGFGELQARVRAWWLDVVVADPDRTPLAVVTHAGVIRALLAHLLAMPPEAAFRLASAHAHCSLLRVTPEGDATVEVLNSSRLPR